MAKEEKKELKEQPVVAEVPAGPVLPPGASIADDGVIELDPRKQFVAGEFANSRLNCYFRKSDGKCVQGPGIRTGHHYVSVPTDLSAPAKEAAILERLALGYVRVEGIYLEGLPGALVMRQPETDFQRLREMKHARATRQNLAVRTRGDAEIAGVLATAERNAPQGG